MELALAKFAINPKNANITISNIIVEKYANPFYSGAIADSKPPSGLVIEDSEIRLNHGNGVILGANGIIRRSKVKYNGFKGISINNKNCLVESNEIAYNGISAQGSQNYEHDPSKTFNSPSVIYKNNWFHHNVYGLWIDYAFSNCIISNNLIENNIRVGLFIELSSNHVVTKNYIQYNGEA